MGRYLDRLRARNFTDSYGNAPTKPTKALCMPPSVSFVSGQSKESAKIRVTLAEYRAILNEAVTGADLPPIPPYRLGDTEHGAAWSAWWDAVETRRSHQCIDA